MPDWPDQADTARGPVGEVVVLAAAALGVVASVLPWYQGDVSVLGFGGSVGVNAWNAGAGAWLSMLGLVVAAVAALVSGATATRAAAGWCWPLVLGLSVFSAVCLSVWWASSPGSRGSGDDSRVLEGPGSGLMVSSSTGPGVGFYLGLLATAATVVTSIWRVRAAPDCGGQTPL
jgi:hypothetical protein